MTGSSTGCRPITFPQRARPARSRYAPSPILLYSTQQITPDAAQWLVVGTTHDDRRAQLRAGEATSALLLTATGLGLATSVQTEPLGPADSRQEIRTGLLHDCAYPQAMVRVGWSSRSAAPLVDTPRRPIDAVLHI